MTNALSRAPPASPTCYFIEWAFVVVGTNKITRGQCKLCRYGWYNEPKARSYNSGRRTHANKCRCLFRQAETQPKRRNDQHFQRAASIYWTGVLFNRPLRDGFHRIFRRKLMPLQTIRFPCLLLPHAARAARFASEAHAHIELACALGFLLGLSACHESFDCLPDFCLFLVKRTVCGAKMPLATSCLS